MNVVCAADYITKSPGAFIESLKALADAITRTGGRAGFLFSMRRPYHEDLRKYGPVYVCERTANKRFSWLTVKQTLNMCRLIKADVVHVHFVGMSFLIAACIARILYRCRVIVHWRNPPTSTLPGARAIHRLSPFFYQLLTMIAIDRHITISRSIADILETRHYVPAVKINVVYNGIDLSKYNPLTGVDYEAIEKKLGRSIRNRRILGMVANFSRQKDHLTLLQSLWMLKNEFPDLLLILVGPEKLLEGGGYLDQAKRFVAANQLEHNVSFAGEWDDVARIISCFDIGILLSNFEGFGNAVVEYMALQKPVVGSAIGGISEIIRDGTTGFLVPPKDPEATAQKVEILLKDAGLRKNMGLKGRKIAESAFSIKTWVENTRDIYQRAVFAR